MDGFQEIENAVAIASEVAERDLDQWLSEFCKGDSSLVSEIRSLLKYRRNAANFLENSPASYVAHVLTEDEPNLNRMFGVYRILRSLGRGGMGAVYLALRTDVAFDRHVAVKIIYRPFIYTELENAFRRERQILA